LGATSLLGYAPLQSPACTFLFGTNPLALGFASFAVGFLLLLLEQALLVLLFAEPLLLTLFFLANAL
jgi:hypothetical protein